METFELEKDITVFGFQVTTFPIGIGEAFDSLIEMVPEGLGRSYYGISHITSDGKVVYLAAVEEKKNGEAEKNSCERYSIEKGKYLVTGIKDWREKIDSIKGVFHEMMVQPDVDHSKPCIEWYKNDDEMLCMMSVISK